MAIALAEKKAIVSEVNAVAAGALSLVVADSRGCSVEQMTALRRDARDKRVVLRIVRNTLAKRAFAGTEYECVTEALSGPSLFGFAMEEPGAAAKLFKDFAGEHESFQVKALAVGGQLLDASQIDALAELPTREQAIAMLMGVMLEPVAKLARVMNEIPGKLARTLAAVREQKEQGGD